MVNFSSKPRATETSHDGDLSRKQKPEAALGTGLVLSRSVLESYDASKQSQSGSASAAQMTALAPLPGSLAEAALPPDRGGLVPHIRALIVRENSSPGGLVPRGEADVIDAEFTVKTAADRTGSNSPERDGFHGYPDRPRVNARDFKSTQESAGNKNAAESTTTDKRGEVSSGGNLLWDLSELFKTAAGRDPLMRGQKDYNAKKVEGENQSDAGKAAETPTAKKAAGGEEKIGSQGPKRLPSKRTTVSSDLAELGSQQDAES